MRRRKPRLGLGELSALTVAHFKNAILVTNDRQARQAAEEFNLPVHGGLGVLEHAAEAARLSGQEAVTILEGMIQAGRVDFSQIGRALQPKGSRFSLMRCRAPLLTALMEVCCKVHRAILHKTMAFPQYRLTELAERIRSAVAEELKVASAGLPFRVSEIIKQGGILTLELEPQDLRSSLDESMEDGRLGWKGETSGSADIISVLPDISYVNAVITSGRPPAKGEIVFINPARFLEPLAMLWDRKEVSERATRWYFQLEENSHNPDVVPTHSRVKGLRPAQEAAFQLVGWDVSYLWGPPGTGKTSTLGWLLASYLHDRPTGRVLLLSTTNAAVDLAILSVDKALPEMFGAAAKPPCLRFGSRFDPKRYDKRDHLIPVRDKTLLKRYELHLLAAPDPAEAEKYLAWRNRLDSLRQEIREQNRQFLKNARLAAMTATYATFQYDDLAEFGPYDLVVFDEASQVGKAHAMTLAGLGKRVLFAGDPKQLSPIVQAKSEGGVDLARSIRIRVGISLQPQESCVHAGRTVAYGGADFQGRQRSFLRFSVESCSTGPTRSAMVGCPDGRENHAVGTGQYRAGGSWNSRPPGTQIHRVLLPGIGGDYRRSDN